MTGHRARIAIVGGGIAGLVAAWRLQALGEHDHVLLEARHRLGGRILDAGVADDPPGSAPGAADGGSLDGLAGLDLGPTWYWPAAQPALAALVQALGLQGFEPDEDGALLVERSPREAPARVPGWRSAPPSARLAGGMQALVDALRRPLAAGRVLTGRRVTRLERTADGVALQVGGPQGEASVWQVAHVLLALPPRLAAHRLAFTPALPPALRRQWQATDTWMAPHAKYLAVYDTPFWRAQGLSGGARSACGPLAEVHDASLPGGPAALFGFVGVPASARRAIPPALLMAHCRAQLGRLFGAPALQPRAERWKDWATDPLTATDADLAGSGQHPEPPALEAADGPWQGRLQGIGSEWSRAFPGYLAGAVEAAERGVQAWRARQTGL